MTRELSCRMKVSQNPKEYKTVSEGSCKEPKPTELQRACYKVACPAEWVPSPWGEVKPPFFTLFLYGFLFKNSYLISVKCIMVTLLYNTPNSLSSVIVWVMVVLVKQQQFFSELPSPRRSHYVNYWFSWVQITCYNTQSNFLTERRPSAVIIIDFVWYITNALRSFAVF